MSRIARISPRGMVFHGLNRGVGRMRICRAEKDYTAFQRVVEETLRVAPIRIGAYCWLSNIGISSCGPRRMATSRGSWNAWRTCTRNAGNGQSCVWAMGTCTKGGSSRSLSTATSIATPSHPTRSGMRSRAGLVERAQDCPWGSLYRRVRGGGGLSLGDWPLPHPRDWARYVNAPQTEAELEAIRRCVRRGSP